MNVSKNRPMIVAIIAIIVLLVLVISTSNTDSAKGPVSIAGNIIRPVQSFFFGLGRKASGNEDKNVGTWKEKYEKLLAEQEKYEEMLKNYEELKAEDDRLSELLNYVGSIEYDICTADIIGTTPSEWFNEFVVNAGLDKGITKDMVVYNKDGLVGRITYSAKGYSRGISIMDESSGIAVMVERTRENAILSPIEGTSNELELLYLRDNADIVPGDVIITSGIGGIYPKGIQVGKVIEVSTENAREKKVKILSTVDFDHIEEVTIVLHVYNEGTD